ncbi:penicillin-binding protein 2 [Thermosediminibacter oceani]|uniref:Penicillin-binding protein 2 n=1 Tax=Thermosediminibacter oceani (strain ATCC BAA-1034 / DSM 16646 / JW/IW-1228P) TaxID=555079 RepID=D9S282_THEOJ|nr:penicillin-binding protein 2 [Thermosediminibacter oceani]ADL07509.1 penicillin-binding protein 2 [Thermosediminibacter oceani DSM 16646]
MNARKMERRLHIYTWITVGIFVFLSIGLFMLQIVNGAEYERLAQENRIRIIPVTAPRGVFKDRNGKELVNSKPSYTVSYMNVNSSYEEQEKVFKTLSQILNMPEVTHVVKERYTVNEKGEVFLEKPPLYDVDADGKVDSGDIQVVHEKTGEALEIKTVDGNTGKIIVDAPADTPVLVSYAFHTFRNKIRDQGYKKYMPVRLKTNVDMETVAKIEERRLPGVYIEVEPIRNYIYGSMAAHIFGYVGEINQQELEILRDKGYRPGDLVGKMGLEKVLEPYLKGQDGGKQVEVTATGKPIRTLGEKPAIPGATVNLTIDAELQQVAEQALQEQLHKLQTDRRNPFPNAKRGAVVVLNVKTGEVLAMANVPSFDPNMFARGITQKEWESLANNPLKPMVNIAISEAYPPGSVFKMVTATAALEEKVTDEKEKIRDPGVYWTIARKKDWKPGGHGVVDVVKAIAESCNIYFYEMGRRLGIDAIEKYARMYGLGNITGIELPGEREGNVASREYKARIFKRPEDKIWYPAETLDAAIGQGYHQYTPLQIASYISAIANEGRWMKPYLVKSIVDAEGRVIYERKPEVAGEVPVSKKTFEIIKEGMRGVVSPGGTAYSVFSDFPVSLGAKTGTAQWDLKKTPHGWFVAFAPFEDPEVAVVVFIEQAGSGGATGGPVAKAILSAYFNIEENTEESNQNSLEITD